MGWVTVAGYGMAALACWRAAGKRASSQREGPQADRSTWLIVSVLMTFLCVNKQLDLQSLGTEIGRAIARASGWYEERRVFQFWLVIGAAALTVAAAGLLAYRGWRFWREHLLLLAGLTFLVTFVVVRAMSFHHVDEFLWFELAGARMNWILELVGIALVWLAALRERRWAGSLPPSHWSAQSESTRRR